MHKRKFAYLRRTRSRQVAPPSAFSRTRCNWFGEDIKSYFHTEGKHSFLLLNIRKIEDKIRKNEGEEELKTNKGKKERRKERKTTYNHLFPRLICVLLRSSEINGSQLTAGHLSTVSTTFIPCCFLFQGLWLKACIYIPVIATCPTSFIFLDFITLLISSEEVKFGSSISDLLSLPPF
jgi:hypothetical protein